MEALGGLAAAERDIRALGTARADSRPLRRLRSLRSPRPHLALPVRQETQSVASATDYSTPRRPCTSAVGHQSVNPLTIAAATVSAFIVIKEVIYQ